MTLDESRRNRIMEFAFKKFSSVGITHVTMDDISRGLGMGKGTLYKFFPSKEALLCGSVDFISGRIEKKIEKVVNDQTLNTVEKLQLFIKIVGEQLSKINPSALESIERSMPEIFDKISEIRERIITNNLIQLFEEGKKNGDFSRDMDPRLVSHILIGAANHIIQSQILATFDYSMDRVFNGIILTILEGCLTEEGRKMIGR